MKIITISREFGSGGREPGKRLVETLGIDYYDREIIAGCKWGKCGTYHLTVNTSDWEIKELSLAVSDFIIHWFRRSK